MCDDGITNGGPISFNSTGGGGSGSCAPANVIIASNVLDTNGNVLCGNIISGDGTFTGNLYVSGNIFYSNVSFSSINVAGTMNASIFQGGSFLGGTFLGNGSGLSNLNASNLSGSANLTSLNTTSLSFQNAILPTNLPILNTAQGTWGSSANVSQVTVDQYGRVSAAANIAITSSQWTTVAGNVAYQNGVSIGTLSAPPTGSNLYVLGTANIDTLNVTTLFANSATVFGSQTLNVLGTSNLNIVTGQAYYGNGYGISNLNSSSLVGNVASANVALVVSQPAQPNITSVGTLTGLYASGNISTATFFSGGGNALSNIQGSSVSGNVAYANVALVVSQASQPNITSVGTLTGLYASGNISTATFFSGGGNALSNVQGSSVSGNVANANVALVVSQPAQPNITSVGTLTGLNVQGLLIASNGSGISNINWSNIIQPFGNLVVSNSVTTTNVVATLANITSLNVTSIETATQLNAGNVTVSNSITVSNLSVSGNIIPVTQGNTYVQGNVVVSGNVYSSLGELGAGGGYYLSLPTSIAVQTGYNGPVYGTTYPLSIGLSNGFTINGTSTLITITSNGNFKFSQAGPYILNAVFNSSDNVTGLAVGSNVADIHGQDQGYLYRYTTFVSQNPTEVITIPINVTSTSLYYYLDLFKVDQGTIYSSSNTSGGTYLTITPLTGGGLATGGPGGTPGTQWISSSSNIYFPNAIGVGGAPTPGYNLTVTGQSQMGNVLPTVDNLYNLGTPAFRWANLQIGPGTIYIQDQAPPYTQVGISVYAGTLLLNGVQTIRTGNVAFIDPVTTYAATMNVTNKVVTYSNVSAVNANAVIYSDGLTQSNAYIKPTSNVLPSSPTVTSVLVDLASSNAFVYCHAGSSLNISVVNPTPAKEVHVFVTVNAGGPKPWGLITCTGIGNILTANTVDSNPYYVYQTICKVSVTSLDTTTQNTFAVIENYYHT